MRILFTVSPSIMPFNFGENAVNAGEIAQISCLAVKGDSPLNISWSFRTSNENIVKSLPDNVVVTPVGDRGNLLLVNPVNFFHQGNYTCRIENAAGYALHSSFLYVNGTYIKLTFNF